MGRDVDSAGQIHFEPLAGGTDRAMRQILRERDAMICRSCSKEERASEGYPCTNCGTFICIICTFRGVVICQKCEEERADPRNKRSA